MAEYLSTSLQSSSITGLRQRHIGGPFWGGGGVLQRIVGLFFPACVEKYKDGMIILFL